MMTLAEQFREEGREEGIEKGREQGLSNALSKTAIRLLTKKFGTLPEDISIKIKQVDVVTLEIIISFWVGRPRSVPVTSSNSCHQ